MSTLALRYPRAALVLVGLVTVVALVGLRNLTTEVGYRAFLGAAHPAVTELDEVAARFGGGLPLAAVWSCASSTACSSALDAPALRMAADVADRLTAVPGVRRVDSPATSPLLVPPTIGLPEARRLAPGGRVASDLAALRPYALADPLWRGQLVSEDGRAGAIIVHLDDTDGRTSTRALTALRAALAAHESAGFEFALVGGPVEFVVAAEELANTMRRLVPVMIVLIALVMTVLLGSLAGTALALTAVALTVLWVFGLMGWLGWPQTSLTQALAPLVLTVGVCDAVHLLAAWEHAADAPGDDRIAAACRAVGPPCVVTTLTTGVGFLALTTSPLIGIVRFGVLSAAGVLAALVLTFTVVPLGLVRTRRRARRGVGRWATVALAATRIAQRRRALVCTVALVLVGVSLLGVTRLQVDASFEDLYGRDSQVVRWAQAVDRMLRRPDTLEVVVTPAAATALPASAFRVIDTIADELRAIDGLGRSWSIVPALRQLNQLVHRDAWVLGDREDAKGRPGSLLRLLASEEPEVAGLYVGRAPPALRLVVEADKLPQGRLRRTLTAVHARLAEIIPAGWDVTVTGPLAVVGIMMDAIRATQLRSFAMALLLVFVLLLGFFRSLRFAALAIVPTVLPVIVTLGAMGLLGLARRQRDGGGGRARRGGGRCDSRAERGAQRDRRRARVA